MLRWNEWDESLSSGDQATSAFCLMFSVERGTSLLKKSTDELLRLRTSMYCCQITENWSHISEFSENFLLSKALQKSFSTGCFIVRQGIIPISDISRQKCKKLNIQITCSMVYWKLDLLLLAKRLEWGQSLKISSIFNHLFPDLEQSRRIRNFFQVNHFIVR